MTAPALPTRGPAVGVVVMAKTEGSGFPPTPPSSPEPTTGPRTTGTTRRRTPLPAAPPQQPPTTPQRGCELAAAAAREEKLPPRRIEPEPPATEPPAGQYTTFEPLLSSLLPWILSAVARASANSKASRSRRVCFWETLRSVGGTTITGGPPSVQRSKVSSARH